VGLSEAAVQAEAKIVLLGRYTADVTKVLVEAMIAEQVTVTNGAPALPPMRPRRQPDGEQRIEVGGQLAQPGQHVGDPGLIHLVPGHDPQRLRRDLRKRNVVPGRAAALRQASWA
jgi:hypothetical protein